MSGQSDITMSGRFCGNSFDGIRFLLARTAVMTACYGSSDAVNRRIMAGISTGRPLGTPFAQDACFAGQYRERSALNPLADLYESSHCRQ